MKKSFKKATAFLLALVMCVSATGVNAYAEETATAAGEQSGWDGVTTVSNYAGENYSVTFSLASYWNGGYNASIKAENTGSSVIENWYLSFALENNLTSIWNAEVVSNENGRYVVKNAGWNADIPVGGSVEFGLSVNENFNGFPNAYKLLGESTQVQEEAYSVEYILDSDWGAGFTARVLLTNHTEKVLEDWTLEFDFDREITSIWNAEIESHENNHYVIKNAGYNANIATGSAIFFGFNGEGGTAEQKPINCELSSYTQGNGNSDEEEIDFSDTTDTDNDSLIDVLEEYYGTNKTNPDTDGDSLSDYIEIVMLGTNPLSPETTAGVADVTLDSDEDGISNGEEICLGLDPSNDDTDCDLVGDAEEIKLGTDPLDYDTDGDGASDGWEVRNGTNPLVAESVFDVTFTSTYIDTVKASVEVSLTGEQVETLAVDPVLGDYLFPEDMPGYIGAAYNFSVDGDFDTATLFFEFDPTQLPEGATPTIYYFNETEQELEPLETVINGNVASTTVEHFSTYILVNRRVLDDAFVWMETWDMVSPYTGVEIVFAIDDSGSMGPVGSNNDPNNERLTVARDLIDKLPENSKIGIVWFAEDASILTDLTTDKELSKSYLSTEYFKAEACRHTSMYEGVKSALSIFENSNSTDGTTLKIMVVLSDGVADDLSFHSSVVTKATQNEIKIYTVGLGSSMAYYGDYMKALAEETGGIYYLAKDANQLASIYEDIGSQVDLGLDTDKDGLPDYYEDNMIAFNGLKVNLDKYDEDTDDDGLLDGQEVMVSLFYNEERTHVFVMGKMTSHPDNIDTDNDSILDADDPERMEYTITDRTLAFVEGLSYTNLNEYVGYTVGDAIANDVYFKNISDENIKYLKDAIIVDANNSGGDYWADFWDNGLGSVALKFVRNNKATSVVYALRGTEFKEDGGNDVTADLDLGIGWDTEQSRKAFKEYKDISSENKNYDYYVVGHSLGGRLVQDVLYKMYKANESGLIKKSANIKTPVHAVTFNALGYRKFVYFTLNNKLLNRILLDANLVNFYYWQDIVGESLGATSSFRRSGKNVELLGKDSEGNYLRPEEIGDFFYLPDGNFHGIIYFQDDYDLFYTSEHKFPYWVDEEE